MKDFFVSYTRKDVAFATWVAEILEEEGYSLTIQEWDFLPGDNFVMKINEALIECKRLIIILSPSYLQSKWCEVEWTTKFVEQINSKEARIIPVLVEPVEVRGLLTSIVHISIVDKEADEAKRLILDGVKEKRERKSQGYPAYYNLEHISVDIDYYVTDEKITYVKTCKSKVMESGCDKVHNRITWFANEDVTLTSLSDGVRIEMLDLHDTNLNYNVVFSRQLQKGEEIEFKVKAVLGNKHRQFKNFFSTEIIAPIQELSIHLTLEDTSIDKISTQKVCASPMNRRTEQAQEHPFSSPYHWHIKNPELNFEYKLFWQ